MSRPLRIEYPDAWYHVMNRGGRYEAIFEDKNDYLVKGMGVRPTQLTAYAFLTKCPNHALHPMNG